MNTKEIVDQNAPTMFENHNRKEIAVTEQVDHKGQFDTENRSPVSCFDLELADELATLARWRHAIKTHRWEVFV